MSYVTKKISVSELSNQIKSNGTAWKSFRTRRTTLRETTQEIAVQCLIQLDQEHPNFDALTRHIKSVGADTQNGKAIIKWAEAHSPVFMNFDEKSKSFLGCKKDKSDDATDLNIAVAETINYWEYKEAPAVKDLAFFQEADAKLNDRAKKLLSDPDYAMFLAGRRVNSAVESPSLSVAAE